jgi:hypothetical protein
MPYDAMVDSYIALYRRLLADREIALRIRNKLRHLGSPVYRSGYAPREALGILWRLVRKGILPGGPGRVWHFLRSLPWLTPPRVPTVISDWIVGLSMREFAERRLTSEPIDASVAKLSVDALRSAIGGDLAHGKITLSLQQSGAPDLAICLKGSPDDRFFKRVAPVLERFLKHPHAGLTLRIEAFKAAHLSQLQELLRKLAPYGDRVSIEVDERLRTLVPIDSSVFHLVLPGRRD